MNTSCNRLKAACGAASDKIARSDSARRAAPDPKGRGPGRAGQRGHAAALDLAAQGAAAGRFLTRWRTALVAIAALVAVAACSPIQPWVKPYEREHLADAIMALDRNPISSTYLDHVFETREGARGATGAVGGGCGCN